MACVFIETFEEKVARMLDGIPVSELVGIEKKLVKMLVASKYLKIVDTEEDGKMVQVC